MNAQVVDGRRSIHIGKWLWMCLRRSNGLPTKGGPLGGSFVESLINQRSENRCYEIIHMTLKDKTMGDYTHGREEE